MSAVNDGGLSSAMRNRYTVLHQVPIFATLRYLTRGTILPAPQDLTQVSDERSPPVQKRKDDNMKFVRGRR
jgi:hypothetical protein